MNSSGRRQPPATDTVDHVEAWGWAEVRKLLARAWKPGEHAALLAPTGSGKSYLWSRGLAPLWSHTLTLDAKVGDPDNRKHAKALGAELVHHYPAPHVQRFWGKDPYPRRHYWLEPTEENIITEFERAFAHIYTEPRHAIRTVYADEFKLMTARPPDGFGLYPWSNRFLRYARARGITFVGGTQNPWWIGPAGADLFGQPRWFFVGRTLEERSLDRYKEISGVPKWIIYDVIPTLGKHEWLLRSLDHDVTARFALPGPRQMRAPADTRRDRDRVRDLLTQATSR